MYQSFYQGRPKQIKTSIPDWSSESDGEHSVTHQVEIVRDLCCSRLRPLPSALEGVVVQSIPNFDWVGNIKEDGPQTMLKPRLKA